MASPPRSYSATIATGMTQQHAQPVSSRRVSQLVQTLAVYPLQSPSLRSNRLRAHPRLKPFSMTTQPSQETTPLLSTTRTLFHDIDKDDLEHHRQDVPQCRKHRRVKTNISAATCPSGAGHPLHHHLQSPSLVIRIEQALEHGFADIAHATRVFFKQLRHAAHLDDVPKPLSTYAIVVTVFVIAVLTMLPMTAIGPTVLLYMNYSGFTSAENITAYVTSSAVVSAVPIVSNIYLGRIATQYGPGVSLTLASFIAAIGLLLVILSRGNIFLFFLGYALYAVCNSIRTIRVALLAEVVEPKDRTTVLATHALMTPIGAVMGPLIWIAIQTYRGSVVVANTVELNRFTLDYFFAASILFIIALVSSVRLWHVGRDTSNTSAQSLGIGDGEHGEDTVHLTMADGHEQDIDLHVYRDNVFRYFCGIMFAVNISSGIYMTSFQPVLVNVFHVSDSKLGVIFEVVALFAILPPLLVAMLSRYLKDRQIIVIGLTSKIIGMILFLPLFGSVREWQVVTGFVLIIKASIFFSTASMSLFTKLLGPMNSSSFIGLLASASSLGPAIAQILLSDKIVTLFGSYAFGLFAIPALIAFAMIVLPVYWKRLDPDREETRLIMEEVDHLSMDRLEAARKASGDGLSTSS